jgi:nucleoside-diphosphate-sugar epimerase
MRDVEHRGGKLARNPRLTDRYWIVTGAPGWVGRNAVDLLRTRFSVPQRRLMLLARSERPALAPSIRWRVGSLQTLAQLDPPLPVTVIHSAFPTQEKVEMMGASEYSSDVQRLRRSMLEGLARLAPVDFVYISSGAATAVARNYEVAPRTFAYGQAKLEDEDAFAEATSVAGGRLCVVRAFALSGPYMTKPDTYALGSMITQAAQGGMVEVKATRPVRRSYMSIDDMLRIAIHAVEQLPAGGSVTFETAGEIVEMGELAARVLAVMGCDPDAVVRPEFDPGAPADDYLGNPELVGELAAAAGVVPASLDDQIAVTAAWLRSEYGL